MEVSESYWTSNVQANAILDEAFRQGIGILTIFLESSLGNIPISHPKKLKEEIVQAVGPNVKINFLKATRNGKIVIVTDDTETASQLLNIKELMTESIVPRLMLETSKFLIYDIPLNVTCEEIAEELTVGGMPVIEVRRFHKIENRKKIPLKTILVTKIGQNLPEKINLWYEEIRIRQFIDRPRQCKNCFQFSHSTKMCKNTVVCGKCGENHNTEQCTSEKIKCKNCGEEHEATSKKCKTYIREAEINKFKSTNHLTITEARRRYAQRGQGKTQTYAEVIANTPQQESKTIQEISKKMDNMLEKFELTLQTILVTQMETFNKTIEAITATFTGIMQNFAVNMQANMKPAAPPSYTGGTSKREAKKPRKLSEKGSVPSDFPNSEDFGGMDFGISGDPVLPGSLSPFRSFLDSPGPSGSPS